MRTEEMVGAIVDAREGGLGPARGVDEVISGGRRLRRRRQRTAGAAGAALVAGVAAVAVGSGLSGGVGGTVEIAPAASSTPVVSYSGCTLEPSTCDPAVIDRWSAGLSGVTVAPVRFSDRLDPEMAMVMPGARQYSLQLRSGGSADNRLGGIDGAVGPTLDAAALEEAYADMTVDVRTVEVPVGDGSVTATVRTLDNDGRYFQSWVVAPTAEHGMVAVSYEGTTPQGASVPGSSLRPGPDSPGGWSDERVSELVGDLLMEPPA